MQPLNPKLYAALENQFGQVMVANEGEEREVDYAPNWDRPGTWKASPVRPGEQYRVDCPFCNDTRRRLYVSYMYGTYDRRTGGWNRHLIHCFNESCHEDWQDRRHFQHLVAMGMRGVVGAVGVIRRPAPALKAPPAPDIPLPQGILPINELPGTHPAVSYLTERGFDRQDLWRRWEVYYCLRDPQADPPIYNRLVIPVYRLPSLSDGPGGAAAAILAGWTSRAIGPVPPHVPKYLMPSGMRKSQLLYGLPAAVRSAGPVVVCEGVADCWKVATAAVALIGKTMSPRQQELIVEHFRNRLVAVCLDSDARTEAEKIRDSLRASRRSLDMAPVLLLDLPAGRKDPGDCTPAEIKERLDEAIKLELRRPKQHLVNA